MESWKSLRTSPKGCRLANCRSLHISNRLHPRRAHEGVIGELLAAYEETTPHSPARATRSDAQPPCSTRTRQQLRASCLARS